MQLFYALFFSMAWFFGVAELSLISSTDALNMPVLCDHYLANKHLGFSCVTAETRLTGAGILFFAFITLLLSVKSKANKIFIIAGFVSFTFLSASIVRGIYFLQGHSAINYFYWTVGIFFSGIFILFSLKKIPFKNWESQLKTNNLEMQHLELEIEERKKEKSGKNLTHHSSGTPNGAP